MDLLASGQADHDSLITYRFPIEEWEKALDVSINKKENQTFKAMFVR
jgi:threonine dehydrogenase-like Zn-dependent dehydrogenase